MSTPDYYADMGIQPITVIKSTLNNEQLEGFYLGQCMKYVIRSTIDAPGKGGIPDLVKAQDYLGDLIRLKQYQIVKRHINDPNSGDYDALV